MRQSILLATGLVVACAAGGCGGVREHEAVLEDMLRTITDLSDVLEKVEDKESAREAAVKVNRICERLEELSKRAAALPKLSKAEDEKLVKKLKPEIERTTKRMGAAVLAAGTKSGKDPDLMNSLLRVRSVLEKLALPGEK
jgi:hypothetical protein